MFNADTLADEGSFFIPGVILNTGFFDHHFYVVYCETSPAIQYSSSNLPAHAEKEGGGDCPFNPKPREWLSKSNLQVARFSCDQNGKWSIINVLKGEGTPATPFTEK